ncbi:MAG: OPT/YSL family transporter [Gemmatimonadota bacterium]
MNDRPPGVEPPRTPRHPTLFEPLTLLVGAALAVLGTVIGLELLTRVGITPNSSIIGAIVAMAIARIPLTALASFRDPARQNLMQTVISGATFGAANALLLPIGVIWLIGRADLVPVMLIGATLGLLIDALMLYRVFDSSVYPATGSWPSGVATAEVLIAGDQGGSRARLLGLGAGAGALGQWFGIPMDVFGVCWIGNVWALALFGAGLLARAYAPLLGLDLNQMYVPHGFMIGAGLVALLQIVRAVGRAREDSDEREGEGPDAPTRLPRSVAGGFLAFAAAASLIALLAGLPAAMPPAQLALFVVFAAVAALASELIVGIAAMHAGWFPAFATALIFLVLGIQLGFPPLPLAFLVGFTASTGPAFADMGYDLKAGWLLRGRGSRPAYERAGRRAQLGAELLGFGVAALFVALTYSRYFSADLFPPVDRVYLATLQAGADPALLRALLLWALPGAALQWLGGPSRQLGVLFATGLLILNAAAGWTVCVALALRVLLLRRFGSAAESPMYVLAGGLIAGSALTSFGRGVAGAR